MSSCQHQTGSHDAHAEANLSRETLTQSRFNNNKKSHKIQRCTHICSTNTHNSFQRLLWNIPYILCQNGLSPLFANSSIFGSFAVEPHRNSMYSRNDCVESNNRNFRFPVRTANNTLLYGSGSAQVVANVLYVDVAATRRKPHRAATVFTWNPFCKSANLFSRRMGNIRFVLGFCDAPLPAMICGECFVHVCVCVQNVRMFYFLFQPYTHECRISIWATYTKITAKEFVVRIGASFVWHTLFRDSSSSVSEWDTLNVFKMDGHYLGHPNRYCSASDRYIEISEDE